MLSYFCMWHKIRIQLYCFACNCWRIPGTGSLVGCHLWVAQSRTRLKRRSSSSSPVASALFVERLSVCQWILWASFENHLTTHARKAMAPHSSTLAWKIPWMEESGRLQSMGSPRVGHDWETSLHTCKDSFLGFLFCSAGLLSVFVLCAYSDDCNSVENLESRSMSATLRVFFQSCFG